MIGKTYHLASFDLKKKSLAIIGKTNHKWSFVS